MRVRLLLGTPNFMNKEELIEWLKENLTIETETELDGNGKKAWVKILIDYKVICKDYFYFSNAT